MSLYRSILAGLALFIATSLAFGQNPDSIKVSKSQEDLIKNAFMKIQETEALRKDPDNRANSLPAFNQDTYLAYEGIVRRGLSAEKQNSIFTEEAIADGYYVYARLPAVMQQMYKDIVEKYAKTCEEGKFNGFPALKLVAAPVIKVDLTRAHEADPSISVDDSKAEALADIFTNSFFPQSGHLGDHVPNAAQ